MRGLFLGRLWALENGYCLWVSVAVTPTLCIFSNHDCKAYYCHHAMEDIQVSSKAWAIDERLRSREIAVLKKYKSWAFFC